MRSGLLRAAATGSAGLPLAAAGVLLLALAASGHGSQRLAMLLVFAPLLEETVFRAGLQEALLRRWYCRPYLANAVTAAAFGLAHAAVRADAAAFAAALPALLIGAVYQRTGRLRHCVVLHAAMNAAWLGWSMTGAALLGYR
ncbi:JDVT-CTERM system glutamic-type intramembrane protease [Caballeronia mineralivorans]|uniref:JDVT-CTERM system glutamic-type intramembrane protease MrtJ n=1 Tax=Caballeronia mineralivorans TaxID=2010198 RepID=UPI0023F17638|nr:JDVT-CTERM system glutamic-type intramembrane protease [Caballeronia mineralivorans]MDB5781774.1 hypothetical protein [Caballeronia mineralivorans]